MIRRLIALFILLAASALAHAQLANTVTINFPGVPSGSCAFVMYGINAATGDFYNCLSGTWHAVGGVGGATAFNLLTSGTNTTGTFFIGTGASLATSGSGTIAATSVTATQYFPLAGNASNVSAAYPTTLVTNSNVGTDFCQRQFNVAAVSVGGNQITTVDARGEQINETAATMSCASGQNPFPVTSLFGGSSTLQGDLFLEPPGLFTLIAPWQIGQNQVRMVGTNWGSSAANAKGTTLQASGSFVIPGVNTGNGTGVTLYNPGLFTIGAGYGYASNGLGPYASDSSYFVTDANSQPGVVPFIFGSGQEGTRASEFTALNGCATLLDEGLGTQSISDGGGLNNFNLSYSAAATCPLVNTVAANISAWKVIQNGTNFIAVATWNNSPTITPTPGMQVVVSGSATGAHFNVDTPAVVGAKIIAVSGNSVANSGNWSDLRGEGIAGLFTATNQFAYLVNQSQTDTGGAAGTANFFGVMGRYDVAKGGSREWSNGTLTGGNAPQAPLIGLSASGLMDQTFRNLHLETCTPCVSVGDDGVTSGAYFDEITTTTATTYGVYFSNAWGSIKNSWVTKLATVGTTNPVKDIQNGNTLTAANNPSLNLYSLDNAGYPFTFANPAAGVEIANGFDFYNGTFGIYNTGVLKAKMDSSGNVAGLSFLAGSTGVAGTLVMGNATSGTITLQPVAGALATPTVSIPAQTGTIAMLGPSTFAQTFLGQLGMSKPGASGAPGLTITGAPFTGGSGTTTTPQLYLNSSASNVTTFDTAGTIFGMNAIAGFTGHFASFHLNGGAEINGITNTGQQVATGYSDLTMGVTTAAMGNQTTATCTNITGMTWNIAANKNYTLRCEIPRTLAATATLQYCLGGPGTATSYSLDVQGANGAAGVWADLNTLAQTAYGGKTTASSAAANTAVDKVWAQIQNGATASGTALTLQTAANGTNVITVLANASCSLTQDN